MITEYDRVMNGKLPVHDYAHQLALARDEPYQPSLSVCRAAAECVYWCKQNGVLPEWTKVFQGELGL